MNSKHLSTLKAKRILISCVLVLIFSANINAQNWHFGVHATPTFNYVTTSQPGTDIKLNMKFSFGLLAEYAFADKYSLATGLTISQLGGKLEVMDTLGDYSAGFVQIPILLKMRTREFGYFTYFAEFGGLVGVETGERIDLSPSRDVAKDLDSYVNPINANFRISVGAEYSLGGSTALFTALSYNRSLIDNLNNKDIRFDKKHTYRFDYVGLTFGIIF